MVSKKRALEEAKSIRARGSNAKAVFITQGLGPGVSTWMIETSPRKKSPRKKRKYGLIEALK